MLSLNRGLDLVEIFEPIYKDILYRQVALDGPEARLVKEAMLEFQELPANIDKLLKTLADKKSDARQVSEIAQLNPAVAAKILRVVNSSYTGLRGKVTSLKRAVALLGYDNIRAMILGLSYFSRAHVKLLPESLPLGGLWKHSAAVSRIGSTVADKVGGIDGATLLSAGLLHDAGKLVMAAAFRERYAKALAATADRRGQLHEVELHFFGLTHPILGAALCKYWNLPERLWGLIAAQEHPSLAPDGRTAAALKLAEFFARSYNIGVDGQWPHGFVGEEVCWHLGLTSDDASRLIEPEEIKRVIKIVNVVAKWE